MLERYWVWERDLWGHNPKRPDSTKKEKTIEMVKAADAQATIADLQGQVEAAQEWLSLCQHELGSVRIDRAILQQRVAQLESLKLGKEVGACEHCLYCVWESCAQNAPNAIEMKCSNGSTWWRCGYCRMKADHARVLGLVQEREYEIKRRIWAMHGSRMGHQLYGDDGRLDCNTCFRKYSDESLETVYGFELYDANVLCAKADSLPAQAAQGGA